MVNPFVNIEHESIEVNSFLVLRFHTAIKRSIKKLLPVPTVPYKYAFPLDSAVVPSPSSPIDDALSSRFLFPHAPLHHHVPEPRPAGGGGGGALLHSSQSLSNVFNTRRCSLSSRNFPLDTIAEYACEGDIPVL
jgi:hypothetical protein